MAIEFPANKFVNDTFDYGGMTYVWDGEKWTASGAAAFEDAYVNISGDTMTGDLTVPNLISEGNVQTTSLNGGPLAGLRNHIINGDFSIWQRGTTYSNNISRYTADRWYYYAQGTNSVNIRRVDNPITQAPVSYALQWQGSNKPASGRINQYIELPEAGKAGSFTTGSTWTFSFYCDDPTAIASVGCSFADGSGTNVNSVPFTRVGTLKSLGGNRYSQTFTATTPGATNQAVVVGFVPNDVGTFRLTGCQLEPGPVATPFEHRPIGTELALCQRYYFGNFQCSPPPRTSGGNLYNDCAGRFTLSVAMRITPTALNIKSEQTDFTSVAVAGVTPSVINASGTLGTGGISRLSVDLDAEL